MKQNLQKKYIQQYIHTLQKFEFLKFCDHQLINMIISHYYALAQEKEIVFQIHINVPQQLPIANSDLTVLLGNLLENALYATSLLSKKNVKLI